ncbi:2-C-methyl-D-erythritol 2,4-cyclodiphosphate synthase [Treponema phagedenis]|uniref:2-C-methyl-D-erythritol 2,4-cyclodiphosphate synthase n=1 Tax=Treponema phagedenis TaxID=162 RepID=UPI0001F638BF|nr:2-C-methyl-D-erythritol 2,4-cyclodiphosphate synthase [Treponema phagedenis F0421]TYT78138.1 2-C-methyl-D-erythritol 2,4-cyclodiphosphate synthase [Treponema phagedenis]
MIRIGLGYDLHVLEASKKLLLGGVHIPFEKGEKAHSDGDVLLHAVTDALLGAAALGDIGELFPPSDNKWKDADSKKLLQIAWQKILAEGWVIENIDCVIVIEKPKILPFRKKIIESIADILTIQSDCVFVKAKTAEGLGAIGASEAVAALVTALLKK